MKKATTVKSRKVAILGASGDMIATNYWLKIGFTKSQIQLLSTLAKQTSFKNVRSPAAACARHLLMLALSDIDTMQAILLSVQNYAKAEGLTENDVLNARASQILAVLGK